LVNINRSILRRIKTVPVLSGYTGIVRSIPVYLVLTMQCIEQVGLQVTCTIRCLGQTLYFSNV